MSTDKCHEDNDSLLPTVAKPEIEPETQRFVGAQILKPFDKCVPRKGDVQKVVNFPLAAVETLLEEQVDHRVRVAETLAERPLL